MRAEACAEISVLIAGRASALYMPENRRAYMQIRLAVKLLHKLVRVPGALRQHDYAAALAACAKLLKLFRYVVDAEFHFRHYDYLRAAADARVQRKIAAVSPHYLYNRDTLVRGHSVAYFIYSVKNRIARRIKAQRVIRISQIVIYGAGYPYSGKALFRQNLCAHKGTVASDNDQSFYPALFKIFDTKRLPLRRFKLRTARGTKYRSSAMNDIGNASESQLDKITFDQAGVTALHAHDLHAAINAVSYRSAHGGVHSGSISSAGQYSNSFHTVIPLKKPF